MLQNKIYISIQMDSLFKPKSMERVEVRTLLSEGLESGIVTPLPAQVFQETEMEMAFRYEIVKITIMINVFSFKSLYIHYVYNLYCLLSSLSTQLLIFLMASLISESLVIFFQFLAIIFVPFTSSRISKYLSFSNNFMILKFTLETNTFKKFHKSNSQLNSIS